MILAKLRVFPKKYTDISAISIMPFNKLGEIEKQFGKSWWERESLVPFLKLAKVEEEKREKLGKSWWELTGAGEIQETWCHFGILLVCGPTLAEDFSLHYLQRKEKEQKETTEKK